MLDTQNVQLDPETQSHVDSVRDVGYTIIPDVFDADRARAYRERISEIEATTLRPMEPGETEEDSSFFRTAGLLRIDPMFWDVPADPTVTSVVEGVLGADFLLSTFSGIDLKPGSDNIQPLHPDDALVPVPRPHQQPIGATAMWVVTPFGAATGGTRVLPGSQVEPLDLLFGQTPEQEAAIIQPEMEPGTVLVFDHALFHGAADNPSDDWRLGLQVSYHAGWVRPYTNWFRSIPIDEVRAMPEKLRDLLGYKTYNGIGGANEQPGSYRESYSGKGRPRDPRLSLD
ncbi:MAG: phytanoyl-CoA dioxygenase family protein [Acidimicrobiales bacterium]|jgi:ectoine hydroxylase-related dioxygenase (phytanoyl-CoA dioxygenase family)|nr:phytanoyl-CoA dioxygenase family protein [Acidimicrobiales bacterium]